MGLSLSDSLLIGARLPVVGRHRLDLKIDPKDQVKVKGTSIKYLHETEIGTTTWCPYHSNTTSIKSL